MIAKIRDTWKWDAKRYPKVDLADPTAARQHVLLHALKAVGAMAACQERYDHGVPFGSEEHRAASVKLLVNALQMLALENMGEDEICREIDKLLAASNA